MTRIAPTDLPQPIYPTERRSAVPPAGAANHAPSLVDVHGGTTSACYPVATAVAAAAPAPGPVRGGGRRMVIWIVAAVAAVVAALAVAVVALTGGKAGPPPPSQPPPTAPTGESSAQTSSAVNTLVSGVPLTNSEYRCVYDGIDARSGLAADIESGSFDTAAAADVIAGCVSAEVIADLVGTALEALGIDSVTTECIRTELAVMSESSLAATVKAMLDSDADEFSTVVATEAAYCFQSS